MITKLNDQQITQYEHYEDARAKKVILVDGAGTILNGAYDYIEATYPTASSELYTYKLGGAAGTTVKTVTVVYTNSAKDVLTSVTYG